MDNRDNVLEIQDVFFKYPTGDWVLRGVNFTLSRGEHALVIGETGSGKTTLARIILKTGTTIYEGDLKGSIRIMGRDLLEIDFNEISKLIHLIGQNPYSYFIEPLVRDDMYSYALKVHGESRLAERAVAKSIEALNISKLTNRYFFELSGGEARRVLVAKSLIADPVLLIFDEPLMWLDDQGVEDFLDLLGLLKRLGKSVLIFEHRFLPLLRKVDKVFLSKKGKLIDITEKTLQIAKKHPDLSFKEYKRDKHEENELILEAKNVYYRYENGEEVLRDINLEVRKNELILVYGLNGSGKTTLLKILAGYLKPKKGQVKRKGDVIYVPQNIVLFYTEETLSKEVSELCKARKLGDKCVKEGWKSIERMGLDPDQTPFNLSHGQMVKFAIELARISGASLLLLDEPFSGLTYRDRLMLIDYLVKQNASVILASSLLDTYLESTWNKVFKLEDGELVDFNPLTRRGYSLHYAAWLYSELEGDKVA